MKEILNGRLIILKEDITKLEVDAIVNAANPGLSGGGGVDGAIHRSGGENILIECKQIRKTIYPDGLPPGEAVMTSAGDLPCRYVIHTVGPVWRGGNFGEKDILKNAYKNCLRTAADRDIKSLAFPAISTGVYNFPKAQAGKIAHDTVMEHIQIHRLPEKVYFVFYRTEDIDIFLNSISR